MTKPDGVAPEANDDVSPVWGTWEELLLAFAVNRHGAGAWDSIASELQKRTSDPNLCLTAHNCRSKYLDLKRRFVVKNGDSEDGRDEKSESAPLLEELRKLRVAELRREVQRYDLNIESLELKMKKMEKKRESNEADPAAEKRDSQPEAATAAGTVTTAAAEPKEDRLSVVEEVRNDQTEQEIEKAADQKSDSCNGSSNSVEEPDRKAKTAEMLAESDGGGAEVKKENSDVQSSATLSRKEEGNIPVRRGKSSGDEPERDDQSRAVKGFPAESQPLADFLQAIRAPKIGSIFERRLRSQESWKYEKLILQHMDFETVEKRLREGSYSGAAAFFRDLLLLVNNALVFFGRNSAEATAAVEIRRLINKHSHIYRLQKEEAMLKPRIPGGSLIVCRKRSSVPVAEEDEEEEPKITKKRTREATKNQVENERKNMKKNKGVLVDALKNAALGSWDDQKENGKTKTTTTKEKKRNVGRPPKKKWR